MEDPFKHIRQFTPEEWAAYPKDHFDYIIKAWCQRFSLMLHVELGKAVPNKLPYRRNDKTGKIEVSDSFLKMVEKRKLQDELLKVKSYA